MLVRQGYSLGDTITPPAEVVQLARIRSGYADATALLRSALRSLEQCSLRAPFAGKVADVEQQVYEKSKGAYIPRNGATSRKPRLARFGGHASWDNEVVVAESALRARFLDSPDGHGSLPVPIAAAFAQPIRSETHPPN